MIPFCKRSEHVVRDNNFPWRVRGQFVEATNIVNAVKFLNEKSGLGLGFTVWVPSVLKLLWPGDE